MSLASNATAPGAAKVSLPNGTLAGWDEQLRLIGAMPLDGSGDDPTGVLNSYRCDCGAEWTDTWDCAVDDDCPACGARHISPYLSEDLDP
ncbi:hypothetical protein [Azospirillum sp. sgz302134]